MTAILELGLFLQSVVGIPWLAELACSLMKQGLDGKKETRATLRRYHPPTAQTPFPLNLDFGDLNAIKSKINVIFAIFRVFSII